MLAGMSAEQTIRSILRSEALLHVDVDRISDTDDLFGAGLTSHGTVTLMLEIEDRFGFEMPEEMLKRRTFETISSLARAVAETKAHGTPLPGS